MRLIFILSLFAISGLGVAQSYDSIMEGVYEINELYYYKNAATLDSVKEYTHTNIQLYLQGDSFVGIYDGDPDKPLMEGEISPSKRTFNKIPMDSIARHYQWIGFSAWNSNYSVQKFIIEPIAGSYEKHGRRYYYFYFYPNQKELIEMVGYKVDPPDPANEEVQ